MAWANNNPGSHIPQWVKNIVDERQHHCCITIDRTVCGGTIDEYDHITNVRSTGKTRRELDRNPDLLQGLCRPCHKAKTQAEARAGRQRRSGKRKPRPHPADALLKNQDRTAPPGPGTPGHSWSDHHPPTWPPQHPCTICAITGCDCAVDRF